MLVLQRKKGESIMVGEDVKITVTDVRGDKVRIGIDAPLSLVVDRYEIYCAKRQAKEISCGSK